MKKTKALAVFAILLFGLIFSPLFFGCSEFEIILNKPTSFSYQINEDTGKEMIVVEANKYASSYLFGISESYDGESVDNFWLFEVPATKTVIYNGEERVIANNYYDFTDIFESGKTYYYFVQYKGEGTYKDSEISEVKSQAITLKLSTPRLSYAGGKLNWSDVNNAESYTVYAMTDSWKEVVNSNVMDVELDVSSFVAQKVAAGLDSEIKFYVYANENHNYRRSAYSNAVTYSAHLNLQVPTNFAVKASGAELTWSPVANAEKYTLKVNNNVEIEITPDDFAIQNGKVVYDARSIYSTYGLGAYTFEIKTNGHGNFRESAYSASINDTYTQKLDTPQNVRCIEGYGSTVEIMWDAVEHANVYILEFSDTANNYNYKQFRPNNSNGIPQDITFNSITLSFTDLGITNIQTLKNSNFNIRVRAQGYNYYTNSSYSSGKSVVSKSQILNAPTLQNNSANNRLTWSSVFGADHYVISIDYYGEKQIFLTQETYFDYLYQLTEAGEYTAQCYAAASNEMYNSIYSNEVTITVNSKLETPVIQSVVMNGENFVINFTADSKSTTQTLYVNGNIVATNLTLTNNTVSAYDVITYDENNILSFKIRSNAVSFWTASDLSNQFDFSTVVEAPVVSISGSNASWNSVNGATGYVLTIDDSEFNLLANQTSVNLSNYVDVNKARQIAVKAKTVFGNSELSNKKIYNRAQKAISNFTDKYFYYGETYDYYIISDDELVALVEYSFFNMLPSISGYIDYGSTVKISDKINSALNKITATKSFTYQITKNANSFVGEFAITMNHKPLSAAPTYTATTTQYSGSMIYSGNGTRTSDHEFASDNYIVSQDVYTTDGLLSAIQNKAKPNFVGVSDVPAQIYQIAKDILIQIIDDDMTDFEKALAIHDYVVTNISYDTTGLNSVSISQYLGYFHFMESALLYNLGVCDAYSKTFALLCSMEEIPCIIVDGLSDGSDLTSGHAWNKIYLDHDNDGTANWFAVDCTYDDAKSGDVEYLYHEYFLIPDVYLAARAEDEHKTYPAATTAEGFYSNYMFDGAFSVKIDSSSAAQQFRNYMLTHQNAKVELLVRSDVFSQVSTYYRTRFVYAQDSNYYVMYTK